jgi:hypothetical protein
MTVTGGTYGTPSPDVVRQSVELLPRLMVEIRRELKNVDDRRKHPRVAANFPVTLYPIHSAGGVDMPIHGRVRDVSLGGICVVTDTSFSTKYAYAVFEGIQDVSDWALLIRFLRTQLVGRENISGGQFRTDL